MRRWHWLLTEKYQYSKLGTDFVKEAKRRVPLLNIKIEKVWVHFSPNEKYYECFCAIN